MEKECPIAGVGQALAEGVASEPGPYHGQRPPESPMKYAVLSIVLGLVGGILGAYGSRALLERNTSSEARATDLAAERSLAERLDRLEQALEERGLLTARLEGRGEEGTPLLRAALSEELLAEYEEALAKRLEPRVKSQVEQAVKDLEESKEEGGRRGRRGRPRKDLAEVAREIGLSASEEDELRRIYADSQNKLFEMMAKPDGDVEQVKRDFEAFRSDETKRPQLMTKYMPKFMTNIGNLMQVQADQQQAILDTVGEDKAAELRGFDIVEANPMGMDFNMSARAGR